MTEINGFCLKCKTYGKIVDGEIFVMKNGRKRMGGKCSKSNCSGKISKIIG